MNITFKKIFASSVSILLLTGFFIILPLVANSITYQALEPTAFGDFMKKTDGANMGALLQAIFRFGIAIAAALAVFMIAWGGVIYMTTDAWFGKEEAKEKIWNAIQGLLLALVSWTILYIVNPKIFSLSNLFIQNK